MQCSVCGGTSFTSHKVLWANLINEWQLSATEVDYINDQQGKKCNQCGSNIRSIALANAIRSHLGTKSFLNEAAKSSLANELSILEINEAGTLTPILKTFKQYTFGAYPEVDMHAMPYRDNLFDIVVHSDTLEHIKNPTHALVECHRVLKPNGALCFTVPIIVGRMSRNREGLAKSFHGNPALLADDFVVHTEFGADVWTYILEAGFEDVSIHSFAYPAGIAFLAKKNHA